MVVWIYMTILIVVLILSTLMSALWGEDFVHATVYGTAWFRLLWLVFAIGGVWHIYKRKLWHSPLVFSIHLSFLVILLGAAITSITSHRGILHIREGDNTTIYATDQGRVKHLPFTASLDSFRIAYYHGTHIPRDYVSHLRIDGIRYTLSMNHIVYKQGYRFYQSSYDSDQCGTILRVNYDPWGTRVTYLGYLLLALSMTLYLARADYWWNKIRFRYFSIPLFSLFFLIPTFSFGRQSLPVVPTSEVLPYAAQPIFWQGRVAPMHTLAQDFLLKLHGHTSYQGLSAMQVLLSWQKYAEAWNNETLIKAEKSDEYISYNQLISHIKNDAVPISSYEAERMEIVYLLQQGQLIVSPPLNSPHKPSILLQTEILYNQIPWTWVGMLSSVILFFGAFLLSFNKKGTHTFIWIGVGRFVLLLFLTCAFILRWIIAERIPLSNGYETLHFVTLCVMGLGLMLPSLRKDYLSLLPPLFLLLVAHWGEQDPGITPLMPVLHSSWLSAHVSIVMLSYACLILSIVERRLLRVGVCLLAAGIFLGAVWANVSWGSYWSWDPKETWALITLLVYSIPLHTGSLPWFASTKNYRIYSVLALLSLVMTYWGVNYLLGGMHSYAN